MPNRSFDWLKQAIEDLKHAELSFEAADYDWACFASQQAAEKALGSISTNPAYQSQWTFWCTQRKNSKNFREKVGVWREKSYGCVSFWFEVLLTLSR